MKLNKKGLVIRRKPRIKIDLNKKTGFLKAAKHAYELGVDDFNKTGEEKGTEKIMRAISAVYAGLIKYEFKHRFAMRTFYQAGHINAYFEAKGGNL